MIKIEISKSVKAVDAITRFGKEHGFAAKRNSFKTTHQFSLITADSKFSIAIIIYDQTVQISYKIKSSSEPQDILEAIDDVTSMLEKLQKLTVILSND